MSVGAALSRKKARLVGAFLKGEPLHCTWQLSARCESFCHFCEHRTESLQDELDTAGCVAVAEELGRHGSLLVSLTGAEPFLRSDLPQIVAAVASRHFPLLVTNGWLVQPASARAVWSAGLEVATVALEHADPAIHDAASGLAGSHARAVAALATLSRERTRRRQRVNVRTRLRDDDVERLPGLLDLAAAHGATVTLEAAFPLPQLPAGGSLQSRLRQLRRRHRNLRTAEPVLARIERALRGGVGDCLAGRAFFNVDHRGRVSRCLESRPPSEGVGTLPGDGWTVLRERLRAEAAGNGCRACFYASRAEVETLYTLRGFLRGLTALVGA